MITVDIFTLVAQSFIETSFMADIINLEGLAGIVRLPVSGCPIQAQATR